MGSDFNTRITLIQKLRDLHDEASWEDFVYYYRRYIGTIITNLGIPKTDVDDLVQEVLMALWKSLPSYDYRPEQCKFRSWLKTVTRNTVVNSFRKKEKQQKLLEDVKTHPANLDIAEISEIEDITEREWKLHVSRLAWDSIKKEFNDKTRQCYLMLAEGIPATEVAKRLDLKVNSVHVFRQRIQEKLKSEIRRLNWELS